MLLGVSHTNRVIVHYIWYNTNYCMVYARVTVVIKKVIRQQCRELVFTVAKRLKNDISGNPDTYFTRAVNEVFARFRLESIL